MFPFSSGAPLNVTFPEIAWRPSGSPPQPLRINKAVMRIAVAQGLRMSLIKEIISR